MISRPPTRIEKWSNSAFKGFAYWGAIFTIFVVLSIVVIIGGRALPALGDYGLGFLTETSWNPQTGEYGILPQIWGTLYSSILALLIGGFFGLAVAIFLSERLLSSFIFWVLKQCGLQFHPFWGRLPDSIELFMKNLIELLAAIPSVVYGLWGFQVLVPAITPTCNWLHEELGPLPVVGHLFSPKLMTVGLLPAALVLAIMILPTVSAVSRDALSAVPSKLREASYGLGATRWETILYVTIPTAFSGIFGAVVLAFGRALGETMALAMLMGNKNEISVSLFAQGNTLASFMANNFADASKGDIPRLMYAAIVLLAITLMVNIVGALLVGYTKQGHKETAR